MSQLRLLEDDVAPAQKRDPVKIAESLIAWAEPRNTQHSADVLEVTWAFLCDSVNWQEYARMRARAERAERKLATGHHLRTLALCLNGAGVLAVALLVLLTLLAGGG